MRSALRTIAVSVPALGVVTVAWLRIEQPLGSLSRVFALVALALAAAGHVPGGTRRNQDAVSAHVRYGDTEDVLRVLLCDAQTSGGLLAAVPRGSSVDGWVVGEVVEGPAGSILVS